MLHVWHTRDVYIPRYGERGLHKLVSWHHAKHACKNEVRNEQYYMQHAKFKYVTGFGKICQLHTKIII